MKYIYLVSLFVLVGCASAKQVRGPNGENAYEIQCGNAVKNKCALKAADVCPHGYRMLERKSNTYDDTNKVGGLGALEIRADTTTTILIQCK